MIAPRPRPPLLTPPPGVRRVGCVSFLNAKPLIDGFDTLGDDASLHLDIPARLLDGLLTRTVDLALCPVIDYFRSPEPLVIVPVGGICCDGPTLTVRLFSRVPIPRLAAVHADTDSHTSVALLRVLLAKLHGLEPRLVPFDARAPLDHDHAPDAVLLIGDKVVTASPPAILYPHQLDLGEAWRRLTGLPFVFATWLARADADLDDLPDRLDTLRIRNAGRINELVDAHAGPLGWPATLARDYLGRILRYTIGPREVAAIERFGELAAELGVIEGTDTLRLRAWPARVS